MVSSRPCTDKPFRSSKTPAYVQVFFSSSRFPDLFVFRFKPSSHLSRMTAQRLMLSTLRYEVFARHRSKDLTLFPQTNSTETLKAPSAKDSKATYFASTTALVQLSSSGSVSYLAFDPETEAKNAAADWAPVKKLPVVATSSSPSGSPSGSGSSSSPSGTKGAQGATSSSASGSNSGNTKSNGADGTFIPSRWVWNAVAFLVGAMAL